MIALDSNEESAITYLSTDDLIGHPFFKKFSSENFTWFIS